MANDNNVFRSTVESLFKGMDTFISSKTVIGDPIHIDDTIILPLVDVSFGVAAGAFAKDAKNQGGGGLGGKMSPCAVLVINNGVTRLINVSNHTTLDRVLDMVPDIVDRFRGGASSKKKVPEAAAEAMEETIISASELDAEEGTEEI